MAGRIRSIKPELLDDEAAVSLSDEAWRLWVSTWLLADDHGNLRAGDRYLASLVWQDSGRAPRVSALLRELQQANRMVVYENGGDRYAHVRNWEKHQRIDNAGKPRVPAPDHEDSTVWGASRRESPRVAASLGDSPLDQRPPTNDLRPPTEDLPAVPAGAPPQLALARPARPLKAAKHKPPARPKRSVGFTLDAALDALRAGGGVLVDPFDANLAGRVMGALAGLQGITPADLQRASAWVGKGGDGYGVEAGELVYGRSWRGRASLVELCHPGVLAKWVAGARAELQPVDDPEAPILCPVDDPTGAPPRWLVESAKPLPAKESA